MRLPRPFVFWPAITIVSAAAAATAAVAAPTAPMAPGATAATAAREPAPAGPVATAVAVAVAPTGTLFPYPIHTEVLENGLVLVLVPMPTPGVVHYQTVVRAGARNEIEPGRTGYAHFFEHMMFRGTARYPEARYRQILDLLGADGNASTGMDQTVFYNTFPATALPQVIEMEADRFRNLSYTAEQFRKEAGAVLGEFAIGRASPETILEETRLALAFGRHTYGHTVIGLEADVRAMPAGYDYSRVFYERYYRPESCAILVAGDFDAQDAARRVRAAYGDWKRGPYAPQVPEEPPLAAPVRKELGWDGPTRPILEISFRTPAYSSMTPVTAALEMIREIYFGATSDLYRELVADSRVAESIGASFERTRDPYLFTATARLRNPADFERVRGRILRALADAATRPVDPARLEAAKRHLLSDLILSLEAPGSVGWRLSDFLSLSNDPLEIERHYGRIAALTPRDLLEAARDWLIESRSITLALAGKEARS